MFQKQMLLSLKQCADQTGIPAKTLRRAVHLGELRCLRPTAGRSAKILVFQVELERWLTEVCAKRQFVVDAGRKVPGKNGEAEYVG